MTITPTAPFQGIAEQRSEPVEYLTPKQVVALIPGMTTDNLARLRHLGKGPRFYKPTPRVVVYARHEIEAWMRDSAQTITSRYA